MASGVRNIHYDGRVIVVNGGLTMVQHLRSFLCVYFGQTDMTLEDNGLQFVFKDDEDHMLFKLKYGDDMHMLEQDIKDWAA